MLAHQALPLGGVDAKPGDQIATNGDETRAPFARLDRQDPAIEIDIGLTQPDRLPQPQPGAIEHQDQSAQHRGPDETAIVGAGRGQDAMHLVVGEDVGQEDLFLDRRQRVLRRVARWVTATAIEAQLAHYAELVGERDGFTAGDTRAPSCYRAVEPHLAEIAPLLPDEAHELIEDELGAPVGDAHRPLEAQELLRILGQLVVTNVTSAPATRLRAASRWRS